MQDTFAITMLFILIAGVLGAFIRGRSRDKCLLQFSGNLVVLELATAKKVWGKLKVYSSGMVFIYEKEHKDSDGHNESSYLFYKPEYDNIYALVRYLESIDEKRRRIRDRQLKTIYNPSSLRRWHRMICNLFKTVRDSFVEMINLSLEHVKKVAPGGAILASNNKYVSRMKDDVIGITSSAYDPILEICIGKRIVIEFFKDKQKFEYVGILKDYTANFLEVMDVDYKEALDSEVKKADVIFPRKLTVVRHLTSK